MGRAERSVPTKKKRKNVSNVLIKLILKTPRPHQLPHPYLFMGRAERSVPTKRKRKNVSNVLIKLILKTPSNCPTLTSSWDVPKGPFLQKRKRKNVSNVLIKLILKTPRPLQLPHPYLFMGRAERSVPTKKER
jgi:predicted CopG family antitoxin